MKKVLFYLIILLGCNPTREFKNSDVKKIHIYKYMYNDSGVYESGIDKEKIMTLSSEDSIKAILATLDSKRSVFSIFMPKYSIELICADTIHEISINGKNLKINGKSFRISKNLIENYILNKNN